MNIQIIEESVNVLPEYNNISIAFWVASALRVDVVQGGLGGLVLREEKVETPYCKDYDSEGERPSDWLNLWHIPHWGVLSAFDGKQRIGGTVVAWRTPDVNMLEGRDDLAVLWDIRVNEAYRGQGIGAQLFQRAVGWACERECKILKVETQNINVGACRFYARQGCELGAIRRWAYPDLPHEVQLLWYLTLA